MPLTTQIATLATRIATEIKAVRAELASGLAGKAASGHSHSEAVVPFPPYTVTYVSGTHGTSNSGLTIDASQGNNVKITVNNAANLKINAPSNPTDGQMLMVSVLASGGARTVTMDSPILLTTSLTASYSITSGRVGFFGLRYSTLAGNWALLAQTTEL